MKFQEIREKVVAHSQELFQAGLFAVTSGNLSIFDRENNVVAITPSGFPYMKMTAEDIVLITLDGEVIEGIHRPSSEWKLHTAVYKNRPDINACVHTHSPYATALAVNRQALPSILAEMAYAFGKGDVPVAPIARPGSEEVGTGAVDALGKEKYACLLANHGALAVGNTLEKACDRAYYLEDSAKIYSYAKATGDVTLFQV